MNQSSVPRQFAKCLSPVTARNFLQMVIPLIYENGIELNQGIRYIFLTSSPNYKSSCVTVTTRVTTTALKILSPDWLIQPKQAF